MCTSICPEPELCKKLGRPLHSKMYERYKNDERFRNILDGKTDLTNNSCNVKVEYHFPENKQENVWGGSEKELPNFANQVANYIKARTKRLLSGNEDTDQKEAERRLEICAGKPEEDKPACPFYRSSDGRCSACGCPVAKKVLWKTEKCPKEKW